MVIIILWLLFLVWLLFSDENIFQVSIHSDRKLHLSEGTAANIHAKYTLVLSKQ